MLTGYTVAKDNLKVNKNSVDNLEKKYAEVHKSCLGFKTKDITYSKELELTPYNISVILIRILIIVFIFFTVKRYTGM